MNPAFELFEDYAKEYNELILWLPTKSPEEFQLFIHEAVRLKKRLQYLADLMAQQQQKKFAKEVQKLISELDKEVERNEKSIQIYGKPNLTPSWFFWLLHFGSSSMWLFSFFQQALNATKAVWKKGEINQGQTKPRAGHEQIARVLQRIK